MNPTARPANNVRTEKISASTEAKTIRKGHIPLGGRDPSGNELGVNSYYIERNGRPFFLVSGEMHFSRHNAAWWEDELRKIKAGGINVVSTYIFWNHHEEIKGRFDWKGNKDLRRFVKICAKAGLLVIVRIGPWDHGEVRNGGFPDWLFGMPFETRSNDPAYLALVEGLYGQIGEQLRGLYYKDGGPIIGTQIENEYMHSAAPWEPTTGTSYLWTSGGKDGNAHMLKLKELAKKAGIDTPFYTCTGWGGAATAVPEMLPLWGGYSFQPWLFYGDIKEHPATPEYIFRDFHNQAIPRTYNFDPSYVNTDYPYSCCEMGGGMTVFYRYRFQLPPQAVEAMAVIKLAGGCNFLGYYMYHGGTNPHGKLTPFLNEHALPRMDYDYQAALGEFGQIRQHYRSLKLLHLMTRSFQDLFCETKTTLNEADMNRELKAVAAADVKLSNGDPTDRDTIRYALRSKGRSGFLFVNNYQDHFDLRDHQNVAFEIAFRDNDRAGTETAVLRIPEQGGFTIKKDVSCVIPFNIELGDATLVYATAQLVTKTSVRGESYIVFAAIDGIEPEFVFETGEQRDRIKCAPDKIERFRMGKAWALVLPRSEALRLWMAEFRGTTYLLLSDAAVFETEKGLRIETRGQEHLALASFPALPAGLRVKDGTIRQMSADDVFSTYQVSTTLAAPRFSVQKAGPRKAALSFEKQDFSQFKQVMLRVTYEGDVANAYVDGTLIADNFSNGSVWEFDISRYAEDIFAKGMYIDVVPVRKGSKVLNDTTMAGRSEIADEEIGAILDIDSYCVRNIDIR